MSRCSFTPRPDGLALQSPYDASFVAAFKSAVPHAKRAWDGQRKVWVLAPEVAPAVADLCLAYFGELPMIPQITGPALVPSVRVIRLEYLGQVKDRDDGSKAAMGYADGAWSIIAPETVLRAWFEGAKADAPAAPTTLYGLLGIAQTATEQEIKQAYRRMARQWHPDVCREPNATEMFRAVSDAYNVLSDSLLRRKYNAGLVFAERERSAPARPVFYAPEHYRAPLRCGLLVAEALPRLGRWELTKILQWDDITDGAGRVMVTSWDKHAERIRVDWVLA